MAPFPSDSGTVPSNATNHTDSQRAGLSTSDIVGITVGVPAAVLALIGVIIATLAWKYPKGSAAKIKNTVLRRPTHVGSSWNSNVLYGGRQKAKTMTFTSPGDGNLPFQAEMNRPITTTATGNAVHVGDSFNSNVLHAGAKQEVKEMTF
ncbi:hypothetical protein QBC36DRAFT_388014 [Triangularia setosa]|uniref:Uncharacterized protein n=1 Tax=Triangularia setosa TaxID=2587417 RepID=A0AAN6W614_9PEZI|nr:hypothetical protein QBC36DRAFT_388014 [Podospora setosa]